MTKNVEKMSIADIPKAVEAWSEYDDVDRPTHYCLGREHEPIDVIEDWALDYCLGNAVKYISRAGRKGDRLEDLRKARWYLDREISGIEKLRREIMEAGRALDSPEGDPIQTFCCADECEDKDEDEDEDEAEVSDQDEDGDDEHDEGRTYIAEPVNSTPSAEDTLSARIMQALAENGPLTARGIAEALGMRSWSSTDMSHISRALRAMEADGRARRGGRATPPGGTKPAQLWEAVRTE